MQLRVLAVWFIMLLAGCKNAVQVPTSQYKIENDQIIVAEGSAFLKHLEIMKVTPTPNGEIVFKTVGQIIALANPSGFLARNEVSWVELDSDLTRLAGVQLSSFKKSSIGTAIGVTSVPKEYLGQIHSGELLEISRYGLKKSEVQASVIKTEAQKKEGGVFYVTFEIRKGQDWYPGTNCEVKFPLLHVQSFEVPTTSILHEGIHEFVMKEITPRHYVAVPVFIVSETPTLAQVIGPKRNDSIVASGAILLKPELHQLLHESQEQDHAL